MKLAKINSAYKNMTDYQASLYHSRRTPSWESLFRLNGKSQL